ncbi:MAG: hypothetical protein ABIK07_07255 [Planctomycetota bacterium]
MRSYILLLFLLFANLSCKPVTDTSSQDGNQPSGSIKDGLLSNSISSEEEINPSLNSVNAQDAPFRNPVENSPMLVQQNPAATNDNESSAWVPIGVVSIEDEITQIHIYNLMTKNGISCIIESTIISEVSVRRDQADRALELVKKDLGSRIYRISFSPDQSDEYQPCKDDWVEKNLRCRFTDFTQSSLFDNFPFGPIFQYYGAIYSNLFLSYPYINTIRILQREYLDQDGQTAIGYEYDIELLDSLDPLCVKYTLRGQLLIRDAEIMVLSY